MTWHTYLSFVAFAVVVTLVPGPDFAVVTRNALVGGRSRGLWASVGVTTSNALQGVAVALGLGAVIVGSEPVFRMIKWVGVAYLLFLAGQALRSAVRGRYDEVTERAPLSREKAALQGWRQGFLSNLTNPKVLAFYLAVLPQFVPSDASALQAVPLALTHALISGPTSSGWCSFSTAPDGRSPADGSAGGWTGWPGPRCWASGCGSRRKRRPDPRPAVAPGRSSGVSLICSDSPIAWVTVARSND